MSSPLSDDHNDPGATGRTPARNNRRELLRYASLSSQVVVSIGFSVWIGFKADKWLHVSFPIFSWGLPLLVILGLIIKLVKESSRRNDGK